MHAAFPVAVVVSGEKWQVLFRVSPGGIGWGLQGIFGGVLFPARMASLACCGRRFSFAPGARGPHSRAMEGMRERLL